MRLYKATKIEQLNNNILSSLCFKSKSTSMKQESIKLSRSKLLKKEIGDLSFTSCSSKSIPFLENSYSYADIFDKKNKSKIISKTPLKRGKNLRFKTGLKLK